MQKLLTRPEDKLQVPPKQLSIQELEQFYLKNMTQDLKIGLEYERLSIDKNTFESADCEKIKKIIEHFALIQSWELVYDNETLIGARDNSGTSISLEPGCQFELSLAPKKNIIEIDIEANKILDLLDKIADIYDVKFIGYGITPKSNVDQINLLDKSRYKIMNDYLPYCAKAELCPKMMRQSAGIQINVDYKDKEDCYNKLKLFNLIAPFISGLYSNSPIEDNSVKEFKSIRSHIWRFTGENRCNLFYKNIFKKKFFKHKNIFKNYINEILNVPMVFIERENENIPIRGAINFREFMKSGFREYRAQYDDYITHQSICFPDVRLKNYIEIRNHDSNSFEYALALCALYKGICLGDIEELLQELSILKLDKTDYYFEQSSKSGLDFKVRNISAWDIVKKIYNFSLSNLNAKERIYLEPISKLINKKKTPADILLDCNIENAQELVNFL